MAKVFISYRRSQSAKDSARIADYLSNHLPAANVFKDIHSISKGAAFRSVVQKALSTTDAVLVLIGPKWLSLRLGSGARRLEDPEDYVRLEVQLALQQPTNCLVIPVLLDHATLPSINELPDVLRSLAHLNATTVRDGANFESDMQAIIERIQAHCDKTEDDTLLSDATRRRPLHTDSTISS